MKQEDLFKKLGLILNELNDQYQFLAQNPQQLNELELELFQANANFLVDHIQIIKKINLQSPPLILAPAEERPTETAAPVLIGDEFPETAPVEELKVDSPHEEEKPVVIEEVVKEEPAQSFPDIEQEVFKLDPSPSTFEFILNDHAEHEKFDFEEDKSVVELFNRPLSEEEERILAQKIKLREQANAELLEAEEDEIGPEPFLVTKEPEPEPILQKEDLTLEVAPPSSITINTSEPVEDPTYKPTLNEMLAKSTKANLNSTATSEIKDLKQAINLNDKLLYIKDLFNGYNLAYAEAIDVANKLPNFEAADNFFQKNYAVKNNWAEKQATVDKFYELLNRRFR